MRFFRSIIVLRVAHSFVMTLFLLGVVQGQDLPARLSQQTVYSPKSDTTLDQLIEVAQHYRIPMGIEWVYSAQNEELPLPTLIKPTTVQHLILSILQRSPGYVAEQRDGVLHIAKADFFSARENFLNLRIAEFQVQNENLFGAEALLRQSIRMTLHPERYAQGHVGGTGYGVPRDDGLDKPTIAFGGRDLTVREILNKIAAASGNAVWVVKLLPAQRMSSEPFFAQASLADGKATADFHWKFIPFGRINAQTETPD